MTLLLSSSAIIFQSPSFTLIIHPTTSIQFARFREIRVSMTYTSSRRNISQPRVHFSFLFSIDTKVSGYLVRAMSPVSCRIEMDVEMAVPGRPTFPKCFTMRKRGRGGHDQGPIQRLVLLSFPSKKSSIERSVLLPRFLDFNSSRRIF